MSNDWDRFVRVIRADGEERTLPLAAWNDQLAERVKQNGGRYILPEEPSSETRDTASPPRMSQRDQDTQLVEELLAVERGLSAWEIEFTDSIAKWLENHDTLTEKQRSKAEQILEEVES